MSCLYYRDDQLFIEDVSLFSIAEKYGTPCYVYSKNAIISSYRNFADALTRVPHLICYAVKANSNLAILQLLANLNSGFDIVSVGELNRVIRATGDPQKTIFSGVGKRAVEIEKAIKANIYCFNIESEAELQRLNAKAEQLQTKINVALRINPNVDAQTHAHIATGLQDNKFGIDMATAIRMAQEIKTMDSLNLIGLACHIGSQIVELKPFLLALDCLFNAYSELKQMGIQIGHLDIGGGLGITYQNERPPAIQEYVQALEQRLENYPVKIILEPGRVIVGNAGVLITRVEYLKHNQYKNFAIVDAGMNDLLRPALYDAWQNILPVINRKIPAQVYDIAGPVCESADIFGKDREMAIEQDDLLAIDAAGAYSFSMSSNYNSRCRAAEILVDGNQSFIIRRRETIEELYSLENLLA